jgi:hypothetical protein
LAVENAEEVQLVNVGNAVELAGDAGKRLLDGRFFEEGNGKDL